ncbi:endolytic transglycosylase MltG [Falsigemmobacter intermedius]|uniref:Endolytic murein transglycosylase n=1 Tax=Falsigemmobacter intermedius TaxID=1553448 RepID=A0A444M9Y6_9RHOB|nr:endolytic transglycosylase MltG [Falsigemmobacter intermedius]RWY39997.1 endolytic transglycosylase MltG [Falsigemmobacter intermedius]
MWKSIASNALTLFIVALIAVAGLIAWGKRQYEGPGPLTEAVCFRVERGASFASSAAELERQGAVSDARIFRIGSRYAELDSGLKAGSYLLPAGISMQEIAGVITKGGQSSCGSELNYRIGVNAADVVLRELDPATQKFTEVVKRDLKDTSEVPAELKAALEDTGIRARVTVAEGTTVWQVTEALKNVDLLKGEVKDRPAEGTLAPDSYEITRGMDRAALVAEMAGRQTRILNDLWAARQEGLPYKDINEALIMASIVEKETGVPDERGQVAAVFVNRLRQGMKLQTDPTVIYGVTKGQGVLGRGLRRSELQGRTAWNTYVIDGLPPTPIANPGRASIEATLNPPESKYLFFVADGTGGHAFAETLAEHNANVAKWRQIEAERARQAPASGN